MKLLWFLLFSLLCPAAFGQSLVRIKVTSGEHPVIKGYMLKMEEDIYVIQDRVGNRYQIPGSQIKKISIISGNQENYTKSTEGDQFFFGASFSANTFREKKNKSVSGIGISALAGYDWKRNYSAMIKAGLSDMNLHGDEFFLPVTLSVQKYFSDKENAFFAGMEVGHSFTVSPVRLRSVSEEFTAGHGSLLAPSGGFRIRNPNGPDHMFQVGLHFQQYRSEEENQANLKDRIEIKYRRWFISYSLLF